MPSGQTIKNTGPNPVLNISGRLAGLALLLLALYPFLSFPLAGNILVAVALVYLVLLFFVPRLWLLVLPVATVCLDLATYTGRFLFNELDLLMLTTIAFSLLSGRFDLHLAHRKGALLLIAAYCAVVLAGFSAWNVFLFPPESVTSNPYYLPEYGYKLIRGMLWALLLTPLWLNVFSRARHRTVNWLVAGFCTAALVLGVIVLWERGTLGVLLSWSAWYHVVNSLLDLASAYRTTGIFSDMHTGGEVIDGIVLLLLPVTLYGIFHGSGRVVKIYALMAFCALAYCATVGFTRATYVSFFVGCVAYAVLSMVCRWRSGIRQSGFPSLLISVTLMVGMLAAWLSFSRGGSYALAACAGLVVFALVGGWLAQRHRALGVVCWVLTGCLLLFVAVSAHFDSRWVDRSVAHALTIGLAQLLFYVLAMVLFVRLRTQPYFNQFLAVVLLVMLPGVFAVALGGYKFNERMDTVASDLDSRLGHWQNVVDAGSGSWRARLLGNGVGSFPADYAYRFPEKVSAVGSFSIESDDGNAYLRLGPGEDLAFGQRIPVRPDTEYTVQLRVRAPDKARLAVFICERNLIFASNFRANCHASSIRFADMGNHFTTVSTTLDSANVGKRSRLSRWPTTLYLKNFSRGTVVELDDVTFGSGNENLLTNGGFAEGLDYWFFYNDFAHLPWHIKNIYVQSWYDNGWIGLGLFLLLCLIAALVPCLPQNTLPLYVAFSVGVIAIAVFGLFGSPLDSARVSWIFYLYIFASLLRPAESGDAGQPDEAQL